MATASSKVTGVPTPKNITSVPNAFGVVKPSPCSMSLCRDATPLAIPAARPPNATGVPSRASFPPGDGDIRPSGRTPPFMMVGQGRKGVRQHERQNPQGEHGERRRGGDVGEVRRRRRGDRTDGQGET